MNRNVRFRLNFFTNIFRFIFSLLRCTFYQIILSVNGLVFLQNCFVVTILRNYIAILFCSLRFDSPRAELHRFYRITLLYSLQCHYADVEFMFFLRNDCDYCVTYSYLFYTQTEISKSNPS